MSFKNRPAVNDPDLIRPTPDIVDQARVVLALRTAHNRAFTLGLIVGCVFAIFGCSLVLLVYLNHLRNSLPIC